MGRKPARVTSVHYEQKTQQVYNFSVDQLECYAVGNRHVLVHNTNGKEAVEEASRLRSEQQLHTKLIKSTDEGVDWIDEAGNTYDQIGNPAMVPHWQSQKAQFFRQIDRHLVKADFVVIDVSGFTPAIKAEISSYLSSLSSSRISQIISIGF